MRPGDAGWFGPDSAAWQVNGIAGHPRRRPPGAAAAGVPPTRAGRRRTALQLPHRPAGPAAAHQPVRHDLHVRLQRAGRADRGHGAPASTSGSSGTAPDGRPYSAQDPRLLLWVHIGLTDSMLIAYQRYGTRHGRRRPVRRRDGRSSRDALGVEDPPTTVRELPGPSTRSRTRSEAGRRPRAVARFLRFPGRALPVGAWPAYEVLVRAATDLLPALGARGPGHPAPRPSVVAAGSTSCRLLDHAPVAADRARPSLPRRGAGLPQGRRQPDSDEPQRAVSMRPGGSRSSRGTE